MRLRTVVVLICFFFLSAAKGVAQSEPPIPPELERFWSYEERALRDGISERFPPERPGFIRLQITPGTALYEYEESSALADSEFSDLGVGFTFGAEFDLDPLVPFLTYRLAWLDGTEEGAGPGIVQENDLEILDHWLDVGLAFRWAPGPRIQILPGLAYTANLASFERGSFVVNGQPATITDLDGRPVSEIEEEFDGHGVTGSLRVRIRPSYSIVTDFHVAYTALTLFKAYNAVGGELESEGGAFRMGFSVRALLTRALSLGLSGDFSIRTIEESGLESRAGLAGTSVFQLPENDTFSALFGLDLRIRF